MNYIILDLEWTGSFIKSKKKHINEVIQFGAVKLDENLKLIDKFESYVRPIFASRISTDVSKLTNISEQKVFSAKVFSKVLWDFKKWCGEDYILASWSDADLRILLENHQLSPSKFKYPIECKYFDLQKYCQTRLDFSLGKQISLEDIAITLEIDLQNMQLHTALDDAHLSSLCFEKVFKQGTIDEFIIEINNEFFERILFKPKYIISIKNELAPKNLYAYCPECEEKLYTDKFHLWRSRNNRFRAQLPCPNCEKEFVCWVQLKVTYDGVVVKRYAKEVVEIDESVVENS
ncbi:MAG: 3'-5' exonuclease [Clostridia bacterium]